MARHPVFEEFSIDQLALLFPEYEAGYLRDLRRRQGKRLPARFRRNVARKFGRPESELFNLAPCVEVAGLAGESDSNAPQEVEANV